MACNSNYCATEIFISDTCHLTIRLYSIDNVFGLVFVGYILLPDETAGDLLGLETCTKDRIRCLPRSPLWHT